MINRRNYAESRDNPPGTDQHRRRGGRPGPA